MVDKVLVGARKPVVDDPVEVSLFSRELDIDPVTILCDDRSRSPIEIRSSAVCKRRRRRKTC